MTQLVGVVYENAESGRFAFRRLMGERRAESDRPIDVLAARRRQDGYLRLDVATPGSLVTLGPFWRPFLALLLMGAAAAPSDAAARSLPVDVAAWLDETGLDLGFMHELTRTFRPGRAALFLVAPARTVHRLAPLLGRDGATIFYAPITRVTGLACRETNLRAAA